MRTFQRIGVFGKTPSKRAKHPNYPPSQKYRKYRKYDLGLVKGEIYAGDVTGTRCCRVSPLRLTAFGTSPARVGGYNVGI